MITPLIITYNEAPNIARTLEKLTWAKQILVIDSFSTDDTLDILKRYPQVKVIQRPFKSFADQCNFGISQIETDWVLSMDADYVLQDDLVADLLNLDLKNTAFAAFSAKFKYAIFGKPLRGTMYPPRKVLYRKDKAQYVDEGHGHRVVIDGAVSHLKGTIYHDDRKSLTHWLGSQDRYMKREADMLLNTPLSKLSVFDRIRRMIVPAPFVAFFYCLIIKGGIFDGWQGWYYACQRMLAELFGALRLIEAKLEKREKTAFRTVGSTDLVAADS